MIIINERALADDAYGRWVEERRTNCPGHVWHRAPHDPAWMCVRCQVQGRIR